jgi:hypothetical protein
MSKMPHQFVVAKRLRACASLYGQEYRREAKDCWFESSREQKAFLIGLRGGYRMNTHTTKKYKENFEDLKLPAYQTVREGAIRAFMEPGEDFSNFCWAHRVLFVQAATADRGVYLVVDDAVQGRFDASEDGEYFTRVAPFEFDVVRHLGVRGLRD